MVLLDIDDPKSCAECPLRFANVCMVMMAGSHINRLEDLNDRPRWCPIKRSEVTAE